MAGAVEPEAVAGETMPAEPTQARRFGKTRTAQSTALLEDYAELIADLLATGGRRGRRISRGGWACRTRRPSRRSRG
jgi:hypothetical protein